MRPRQWVKNVFVLAALVFDRQLLIFPSLLHSLAGFALFCMLSSAVYVINDIVDLEADRRHPTKCKRPIASGKLPVPVAIVAAVVMVGVTLPLAYLLSPGFALIALIYFLLNLAYSNWLKHIQFIDVLVLSASYVLRVAAGVSLIQVERFSPWLYVCTTLLALYLGLGKRRAEITLIGNDLNSGRKVLEGYTIPLLDQLITIVSGTTIVAYSFYTFSAPNLPKNHAMMLTIPFVLYAIFRYLYLVQVKCESSAPDEIILSDRPLQISFLLWGLSVMVIFYLF